MITQYKIGLACKLSAPNLKEPLLGRIIADQPNCEVKQIGNNKIPSMVFFCTPNGREIKTGVFYLTEIKNEKELQELIEQEKEAELVYDTAYNGKIKKKENK